MNRALKITAISAAVVIAGIFAVYCKAGFFDYLWIGTADFVVSALFALAGFCIGWYGGSKFIAPYIRKWLGNY